MKVIALNGSPRKQGNTRQMLDKCLLGSSSAGAETELIHLYDITYKGCISCFSCKKKGNFSSICLLKDDLFPILKKCIEADALVFGTPIYFRGISSGLNALLERIMFPLMTYNNGIQSFLSKQIPSVFLYTMNVKEEIFAPIKSYFNPYELYAERLLRVKPETLYSYNTYQFSDYKKYESLKYSEEEKARQKKYQFPIDLGKAYHIGSKLTKYFSN